MLFLTPLAETVPPGTPHVEDLLGGHVHLRALPALLIRTPAEDAVEDRPRDGNEVRMRDPGAIEAIARLAQLVVSNLGDGHLVDLCIAPAGDECRHPAHRVRVAAMTGLHQQLGVRAHEGHGHRHLRAIGQHRLGTQPKLLDAREDVVPAPGIEPSRVLAELVQDLVHLERGQNRLDEHRRADRAARDA